METTLTRSYVGANRYCDEPAMLLLARHGLSANQQVVVMPGLVAALGKLRKALAESAYAAPSLVDCDDHPGDDIASCHLWLHGLMAGIVHQRPALMKVVGRQPDRYRALISWSVTEGILFETFSFSGAAIGFLCRSLLRGTAAELPADDFLAKLERLEAAKQDRCPEQFSEALISSAISMGIPVFKFEAGSNYYQMGQGAKRVHILKTFSDASRVIPNNITRDKWQSSRMMRAYSIPCADSRLVTDAKAAVEAAETIGYPLVIKPQDGRAGYGITVGVRASEEVGPAFKAAIRHSEGVIVESYLPGDDHRILVLDGKVLAVAKRDPAHVIGNGVDTVTELISRENTNPLRGEGHLRLMQRIVADEETQRMLSRQELTLASVPSVGQRVDLKGTSNVSTGGSATDRTADIHPDNRIAVESAARLCGGNLVGVDFLSPDISRSWREVGGGVCELNMCPGLRPNWLANPAQDIAGAIVRSYLPDDGRIPIAAITGTNGKTTTTNMLAHIMTLAGFCTGKVTTTGVSIGADEIKSGDSAGSFSAQRLLVDPLVEAAVLEVARGGLLSRGLGFDHCNVSAVTNVGDDHIGENDVSSIEELAAVKSIVARSSRDMAVLNADNDHCLEMITGLRSRRLCLVTRSSRVYEQRDHFEEVLSCRIDGDDISLVGGDGELLRIPVVSIPATFGGLASFNIDNAQFAIAMAYGMGVEVAVIERAMTAFEADFHSNKGRCNLVDRFDYPVLVDYAHNNEGFAALSSLVGALNPGGRRILVFSLSGIRADEFYPKAVAALSGSFDRFYCYCRDPVQGGREPQEVVDLTLELLRQSGIDSTLVSGFSSEAESVTAALAQASERDVVAICSRKADETWKLIHSL